MECIKLGVAIIASCAVYTVCHVAILMRLYSLWAWLWCGLQLFPPEDEVVHDVGSSEGGGCMVVIEERLVGERRRNAVERGWGRWGGRRWASLYSCFIDVVGLIMAGFCLLVVRKVAIKTCTEVGDTCVLTGDCISTVGILVVAICIIVIDIF